MSIIKSFKIEWETDKDKMDFSKLRWFPEHLLNKPFKIKYVSTENLLHKLYHDSFNDRDETMNDLIDFVNTGTKIIPPSFIKVPKLLLSRQIENKVIAEIFTKQGLYIHDGCHRFFLAKALGLKEIPILVFNFDEDCKSSINNWVAVNGCEWSKRIDFSGSKNENRKYFYHVPILEYVK